MRSARWLRFDCDTPRVWCRFRRPSRTVHSRESNVTTFPPALNLIIRRQHGVVATQQFDTHGITRQRRRTLIASGLFDTLHRGVYILASAPLTLEARCVAACLANPAIVICGTTAGQIMHLRNMVGDDIHAMALNACPQLQDVVTHRTYHLQPSDVVTRPDGIRVLRPRRLAFNLADYLDDLRFESALEQMLDRGEVTVPELFAASRSLSKRGRDGTARFARVLAKRPSLAKPKDSDHEVRLLRALAGRGVALIPQFELTLPDGTVIHLDGGDPTRRFGVEVDHVTWHGGRARSGYDKWRDRQTDRIGWLVSRVPDEDLDKRFHATISELVEIHHGRVAA